MARVMPSVDRLMSMQRTDTVETNESPFGSNLNTPADEEMPSLDHLDRLLTEYSLDIQKTPRPSFGPQRLHRPMSVSRGFAREIEANKQNRAISFVLQRTPVVQGRESIRWPTQEPRQESGNEILNKLQDLECDSTTRPSTYSNDILQSINEIPSEDYSDEEWIDGPVGVPSLLWNQFVSRPTHDISHCTSAEIFDECMPSVVIKAIFFLPWCAAVGGAILMAPDYLDFVAFRTGYIASPKGIHRFAYWAHYAAKHVVVFLTCLAATCWWNSPLSLLLSAAVLSRTWLAWQDITLNKAIPLGKDDRQSLYLLVRTCWLGDDLPAMTKAEAGYHISHKLD